MNNLGCYLLCTLSLVRDISALSDSHKSNASYTAETDLSTVFSGNNSCVLSPEQIEGPYCKPETRKPIQTAISLAKGF